MKQIKKTINNNKPTDYQLRVMQIVMEVWEQQFLKYKDWTECWPAVFAEPKSSKGFVNVILTTGTNFTDIDIERFKKRCIEEFGENCNPALGKVKTRKGLIVRYLQWKEPVKDWPILSNSIEPDSWLDCVWYYEQIGKPWPSDILKFGNIFINGEEYRPIFTDTTEQSCAMFDGVLKIIDGDPFVPVWWRSEQNTTKK